MATQAAMPLNATPAAGQIIEHDGKTYETVREGQAYILIPPNTQRGVDPKAKVKAGEHSSHIRQIRLRWKPELTVSAQTTPR